MVFKISQNKLLELLGIVGKAVSNTSPIPSMLGIKFDVKEDELILTGTDSDISIQVSQKKEEGFTYDVMEEGSIVINKSYINEIIRRMDSDVVNFETVDGNLTRISGDKAQFDINGFSANDYPVIDFTAPEKEFSLAAPKLKKLINQTYFAAHFSETRPILTAVHMENRNNHLLTVATNSYRLAQKEEEVDIPFDFQLNIMAKSLLEVSRSFNDDEVVTIAFNEKKAQFFNDRIKIQTRLIEGVYPDTSKLIPDKFEYELILNKRDLLNAISRCTFIKNDEDKYATLFLEIKNGEVELYSESVEIGSFQETLNPISWQGKDFEISFSSKYVEDALNGIDGEEIHIQFVGNMQAIVMTSPEDPGVVQLVLPLRVRR